MIGPTTGALASVACIAATSSWWAVVRRTCVPSEHRGPNPDVRRSSTIDALSSSTPPTLGLRRNTHAALIRSGIFGGVNPDVVADLVEHVRTVRFPCGHAVFSQGDPGSCMYLIASGKVKLAYRRTDGRELVVNVVGASDVFGEVPPFDCGTSEFTATTITEMCAVEIERGQLLAWMAECPEMVQQIMRLLARRTGVMTSCLADLVFADPPYRVASRLLLLSKRFGQRDGDVVRVKHDLTLDEISLFAGVSPEPVDATLRDFSDRGWIRLAQNSVEIVDGHGLAALPAQ